MVLELTLKHVKALTNLIEQQQQKIIALQNGLQAGERRRRGRTHARGAFSRGLWDAVVTLCSWEGRRQEFLPLIAVVFSCFAL